MAVVVPGDLTSHGLWSVTRYIFWVEGNRNNMITQRERVREKHSKNQCKIKCKLKYMLIKARVETYQLY